VLLNRNKNLQISCPYQLTNYTYAPDNPLPSTTWYRYHANQNSREYKTLHLHSTPNPLSTNLFA